MPFYYRIDGTTPEGKRTAASLIRLRDQMNDESSGIPARTVSDTLLLATWNIREFDTAKYGPRLPESYYYIAEIISRFDLVAVQEVREDMAALNELTRILGSWWDYLVTDVTCGHRGNGERLAFLYDKRKVSFRGLAGEVVLPPDSGQLAKQLARTPYICGFQTGWSKFNLCTVHILYGEGVRDDPERIEEIDRLCRLLAERARKEAEQRQNLILLGDFNIFSPQDVTMRKITDAGFCIPPALQNLPGSNVSRDKFYDQIAFMVRDMRLSYTGRAGIFDYYQSVFREADKDIYLPAAQANYAAAKGTTLAPGDWPGRGFGEWRTYQMSDHLPMWVELKIDFGKEYLDSKVG